MAAVEQITPGLLAPSRTHTEIIGELKKANQFLKQKKELVNTPVNKLPGSKQEKIVFQSQLGSELNVDQKGKAALSRKAVLIRHQIKQAGNALTKEQKYLYEAQAEASEAIGQFLETLVGGKSFEQAFSKKKGWFGGYTVTDRFIRATLTIAEKSGNTKIALENIKALETLKEVPIISAALAKNAEKIAKLKSKVEDPRTAAFQEISETGSSGKNIPSELANKLGGSSKGAADPEYAMSA